MKQLILLLIFSFSIAISFAQETPKDSATSQERTLYLIKKSDGNEFYGYILSDDGREILLETKTIGKIYINKSDIKEIKAIEGNKENLEYGEYRAIGPFTTRYYFTTNALPIKKDEHYALIHLYGPEVHFALSDNFSLGLMSTWIASPIALAAKYSFNSTSKTYFSIGTLLGSSGYLNQGRGFGGLHFLTMTNGDRGKNISFSAGYGYYDWGNNWFYNNQVGEKYSLNNYDTYHPYYIEDYNAYDAIEEKLYGNGYSSYEERYFYRPEKLNTAFVFGLSGIAAIGKKASFIFDSMFLLGYRKNYSVNYSDYNIEVTYYDYYSNSNITETYIIGKGELVENGVQYSSTLILMPAMRFHKNYNQAFQVALAGVIHSDFAGYVNSFPIPMVSWLFKF